MAKEKRYPLPTRPPLYPGLGICYNSQYDNYALVPLDEERKLLRRYQSEPILLQEGDDGDYLGAASEEQKELDSCVDNCTEVKCPNPTSLVEGAQESLSIKGEPVDHCLSIQEEARHSPPPVEFFPLRDLPQRVKLGAAVYLSLKENGVGSDQYLDLIGRILPYLLQVMG